MNVQYAGIVVLLANVLLYFSFKQYIYRNSYKRSDSFYPVSKITASFKYIKYIIYSGILIQLLRCSSQEPTSFALLIGGVLAITGWLLLSVSLWTLGANFSPCNEGRLPSKFITTGIYRVIRHPVYLGNVLQIIGILFWCPGMWIGISLTLAVVFYGFSIADEEKSRMHFNNK
ncbi:MAG: methyltransferase [Candidatus Thiodiazotropha sp.]